MSGKKLTTRREFLRGATIAGASVAATGAATSAVAAQVPQKWDMEADVVVLGMGGAGMSAAIEAADAGAKVMILEKQPEETHYSNTRMSGGIYHCPNPEGDAEALAEYLKAMFSGDNLEGKLEGEWTPELLDEMVEAFAEYEPQNIEWMKSLDPEYKVLARGGAAFPTFPGAKESMYETVMSTYTDEVNFDVPTKDLPKTQKMAGEAFHTCLLEGVKSREIDVQYETPARRFVMEDGEVVGVIAEQDGKEIAVKANRGVVLATGGYEYNMDMRRAFLEGPGVEGWAFYGTPENTGDGIIMALDVGARIAKAGKAASRIISAVPIRHHGLKMGIITDSVGRAYTMVVDSYGNRYAAENLVTDDPSRYFFYKEAVKFDILELEYPRIPSWMIFDETMRKAQPLTYLGISTAGFGLVPWSEDNMDAIERGWIIKGETIEELAEKINEHPDSRGKMDVETLAATLERFNGFADKGEDEDFARKPETLKKLDKPPYYAIPLYPGGPNTKGGIEANGKRQVINWFGEPIPRLYTAGEISSVFKFVYQGGGNVTECIVCGRIAGKNAAAEKPRA